MTWLFFTVIAAMLVLAPSYLILNYRKKRIAVLFKGALTFIILAAVVFLGSKGMWLKQGLYPYLTCMGLFFGFLGDVGIEKKFIYGVAAFLVGHIVYIAAFLYLGGFTWISVLVFLIFSAVIFGVYKILKPDFGKMLKPVAVYTLIIGVMLAVSVVLPFGKNNLPSSQINLIAVGSVLFVMSDFLLAIFNFLKKRYPIRVANISLYFIAQLLLAASVYPW
jgi:uncharacterized membrane protein YhhN